jgi:hypothetical protein
MTNKITRYLIIAGLAVSIGIAKADFGNGDTGAPAGMMGSYSFTTTSNTINAGLTNFFLLFTNQVEIYKIQLATTVASGATVTFYDTPNTNAPTATGGNYGPYYVLGAGPAIASYTTNIVSSYVGYNGVTNWYTNSGQFTYTVTNGITTNASAPVGSFFAINNAIGNYGVNILCQQGLAITTSSNVSMILYYRSGH